LSWRWGLVNYFSRLASTMILSISQAARMKV
jgi:hypothetical protein